MSDVRSKPLNAKTRISLGVALTTIHDEWIYLNDALKTVQSETLKERFTIKRDHLQRAGAWLESKLAATTNED